MAYPQPNSNGCWTGSLKEMPSIYTLPQVNKLPIISSAKVARRANREGLCYATVRPPGFGAQLSAAPQTCDLVSTEANYSNFTG
jgi:hypothetical protein